MISSNHPSFNLSTSYLPYLFDNNVDHVIIKFSKEIIGECDIDPVTFNLYHCLIAFQGNVEVWLNTLLKESRMSLHSVIQTASIAIKDPAFKLKDFLDAYPAQVRDNVRATRTQGKWQCAICAFS